MEVSEERRWRHDAGWAVAVIIAAIILVVNIIITYHTGARPEPEPPPDEFSYWRQMRLLQDYLGIVMPLLAAGALSLLFYLAAFARNIRVLPQADQPPVVWNLWDVVKAVAGTYLVLLITRELFVQLRSLTTDGRAVEGFDIFFNAVILHAAILVLPLYFVSFKGGSYRALGFTVHKWISNVLNGLFVYLAILPLFALTVILWSLLLHVVGAEVNPPDLIPLFEELQQAWLRWALVGVVTVFGPITEEVCGGGWGRQALLC